MAQWLTAPTAFPEDPGPVPRSQPLVTPVPGDPMPFPDLRGTTYTVHTHMCRQSTAPHKNKSK